MARERTHLAGVALLVLLAMACEPASGDVPALSAARTQVEFWMTYGGMYPKEQTVHVIVPPTATAVLVTPAPGVTEPSWLHYELSESDGVHTLTLFVKDALLPDTYTTTLRVFALERDEKIGSVDIQVSLHVTDGLLTSQWYLTFHQRIGSTEGPAAQTFVVDSLPGRSFTATADQPWIEVTTSGDTVPGTVTVSVDPTGFGEGSYSGEIRIVCGPYSRTVFVTLYVVPPLLLAWPSDVFTASGTSGGPVVEGEPLTLFLLTGANEYPVTAVGVPSWLQIPSVVMASETTLAVVDVRWDPSGLAPGVYTARVEFQADVNGLIVTSPVTFRFTVDPP